MQLDRPFLRLPRTFDAEALAAEVRALPKTAWTAHPQAFPGNDAVRLITPGGRATDLATGPMAPTPNLNACPYIKEIMAELGGVWGRSRLMGLAPGAEVPEHVDIHYYWQTHIRLHIPVITDPAVEFTCDGETIHMAPGECWTFDSFRLHEVQNRSAVHRVHLVLDAVGSADFGALMTAAAAGETPRLIRPGEAVKRPLRFERVNSPDVMSPWEVASHVRTLTDNALEHPQREQAFACLDRMIDEWKGLWAEHGDDVDALPVYMDCIARTKAELEQVDAAKVMLKPNVDLLYAFDRLLFENAVSPIKLAEVREEAKGGMRRPDPAPAPQNHVPLIERPIFIVSPPRSGSTMLFEALSKADDVYAIHGESHSLIEGVREFQPINRAWASNRLTAEDASPDRNELLASNLYRAMRDRAGRSPKGRVRMLEKTPKNALRVGLFDAVWADAQFVYLYRDPRQTVASMIEAWMSGRFRTYPQLPGWPGPPWSMLLVPGWRDLAGLPVEQVAAHQWSIATNLLLDDLEELDPDRVKRVDYDAIVDRPGEVVTELAQSLGLSIAGGETQLPPSWSTVSAPRKDKWRRMESIIDAVMPIFEQANRRARAFAGLNEPAL